MRGSFIPTPCGGYIEVCPIGGFNPEAWSTIEYAKFHTPYGIVGKTSIVIEAATYDVSTVFLSNDHNHYTMTDNIPILWETMIFGDWESTTGKEYQTRCYGGRVLAQGMHIEAVMTVFQTLTPNDIPQSIEEINSRVENPIEFLEEHL